MWLDLLFDMFLSDAMSVCHQDKAVFTALNKVKV